MEVKLIRAETAAVFPIVYPSEMPTNPPTSHKLLEGTREQWPLMSLYERFEHIVTTKSSRCSSAWL